MEETVRHRPRTTDMDDEEREYRKSVREDVRKLRGAGIEVVIPADNPDPGEPE